MEKSIKKIKTAKDLESVNPLDNIELAYYYPMDYPINSDIDCDICIPYIKKGIYGGSFNIKDNNYIVISNIKQSEMFEGNLILTSSLYQIQKDVIINNMYALHGYCDKEDYNLEEAIKKHIKILNDSKLRELNKQDNKQ